MRKNASLFACVRACLLSTLRGLFLYCFYERLYFIFIFSSFFRLFPSSPSIFLQSRSGDVPHMMFYGPSGAGKKTRISAFLREVFGPGADKLKVTPRVVTTKSKTLEIASVGSSYHIELSPSDVGNNDTHVIQEVIREIAMTQSVSAVSRAQAHASRISGGSADDMSDALPSSGVRPAYKVVVLHDVDKLSADAQHGLRRTMEQYTQSCRLILCCESACKVAAPLKSRCLLIRVPSPSNEQILSVFQKVAQAERFDLPIQFAQKVATACEGNLRRGLLMLEASKATQYPFTVSQEVKRPDWSVFVSDKIVPMITQEQSARQLLAIRAKIYEMLANCVPADVILRELCFALARHHGCDEASKHAIARWAAFYEHRVNLGSKPVFHIEAFVAKIMAVYKGYNDAISV